MIRRLLLAAAALAALAGCHRTPPRPPCPAGQVCLAYGNNLEPATLDPQAATAVDEFTVIRDLMMGLTTDAPDGKPIPGIAQAWETSPDGRTWTFHLRPAQWSDGAPVTAGDFVFAWRRLVDPKSGLSNAYLAAVIKNGSAVSAGKAPPQALGVSAPDVRTLVVRLEHPAPYLPDLMTLQSFYPLPQHVIARAGAGWTKPGTYVSDGAYRLVAWRMGDRITVEKNPRFWDAGGVCVDRIDYYPTPDVTGAERRVKSGELDLNTSFQANRIDRLRRDMPGYARAHVSLATEYMSFNRHDVPALGDIRVRRALSEAIDREFITGKLLRGLPAPAYAFVPPVVSNYARGPRLAWADKPLAARQAQARALLRQAGYGPAHPLKLTLKVASQSEALLLAEAIQADWRSVGVDAAIAQNEGAVALAAFRNRDFQVGLMNWYADFDDPISFLGVLKSDTGAQNYGDWRNPTYDALLEAADREPDAASRAQTLARAEQLMLDDEAMIPLFFIVNRNLVGPRVTGWVDNAPDRHRARWLCLKGRPPQ